MISWKPTELRAASAPTRLPRLAMVMCVRNEAKFLLANLLYHRALGVQRAYVFLDRCTDASPQIAAALDWVRPICVDPADAERFAYVADLHRTCMDRALASARDEGFDWLLTLDADEFAFGDNTAALGSSESVLHAGDLPRMLARSASTTEIVRMRPEELVPADLGDDQPFWKQTYFLEGEGLQRQILDPRSGVVQLWDGPLGHRQGKSIVRTSADVQAYGSHGWVRYQGPTTASRPAYCELATEWLGYHFHFLITSFRQWKEKHQKLAHEPDRWFGGDPVEFPKECWKRAASTLNDEAVSEYYRHWVALSDHRLRSLESRGIVRQSSSVEDVLRQSGALRGDRIARPQVHEPRSIATWSLPQDYWAHQQTGRPRVTEEGRKLTYLLAEMPHECLRGFHLAEVSDAGAFRWAGPYAELRMNIPADDYLMQLEMKQLHGLWRGKLEVSINDRPVTCREYAVDEQGTVNVRIRREDFGEARGRWLRLTFEPIDTSNWPAPDPRELGAPVYCIAFKALAQAAAV